MTLGLIQYWFGRKNLPAEANAVPNPLPRSSYRTAILIAVGSVLVLVVLVLVGVIRADNLSSIVIIATLAAAIAYFTLILFGGFLTFWCIQLLGQG